MQLISSGGEEYSIAYACAINAEVKNYAKKKPVETTGFRMMVEGGGFEPPKAEPSDLQSDPFGHSGTPPQGRKARQ